MSHQIEIRVNGVWLPVGARTSARAARTSRQEWIKSASRDNGPDAGQYVRVHTRVLRFTTQVTSVIVEAG